MDSFGLFILLVAIATIVFIVIGMRYSSGQTSSSTGASTTSDASRQQMAEDIRMTKTSRVVDEVSIVDELSATSPGFRQYCELVGTSQREGGVTAPYSRKQVAYYEIRCYRIDNNGSRDVETLVAHEKSFDPFYFTDDSCDTPVYIDINSFGENVILINSTNHIEGPNSDFSKAMSAQGSASASTSTSGTTAAYAVTAGLVRGVAGMLEGLLERLPRIDGLTLGPQLAMAGGPALAGVPTSQEGWVRNRLYAHARGGASGAGGSSGGRSSMSGGGRSSSSGAGRSSSSGGARAGFSSGSSRPSSSSSGRTTGAAGTPGLGQFLGSGGFGGSGGFSGVPRPSNRPQGYQQPRPTQQPRPVQHTTVIVNPQPAPRPKPAPGYPYTYRRNTGSTVLGDMVTYMTLSTILDSMASSSTTTTTTVRTDTFRGYRLVEDVVPLGSPVYCIGEMYRQGTDVYMGRSLAADYPTSFFATRPEAEVLNTLTS